MGIKRRASQESADLLKVKRRPEKILCAAVKIDRENKDPLIISGFRHGDCFKIALELNPIVRITQEDQGFLTSNGRFVDRKEANTIAIEQGQTEGNQYGVLISEDLY